MRVGKRLRLKIGLIAGNKCELSHRRKVKCVSPALTAAYVDANSVRISRAAATASRWRKCSAARCVCGDAPHAACRRSLARPDCSSGRPYIARRAANQVRVTTRCALLRPFATARASRRPKGGGRFVPRNERARLMRACRSARVDFSRVLTVGSAGATALPSSQTQTSIGRAAQDPQSRCAQRAEAASVCSGLRRDAEHAFDRTSRMPGSRGCVTKPAWSRSAHLAANAAGLPRRETAETGAPNAIKVRVRARHAFATPHTRGAKRTSRDRGMPVRSARHGLSAMRPSRSPFVSTVRKPKEIDDEVCRLPSVSDYMCGFERSSRTRRATACPRSAIRIQPMRGISRTRRFISLRLYFAQCCA
ncbi:hypothetical protein DM80_3642 [Burkholderia multivorans]|nr:hypothetical protein DM80_3642 [Burkholderia multivorans]